MDLKYKQAILLRKDLNLSKGKAVAQGAHASVEAYVKAKETGNTWLKEGMKKVVLEVANEQELIQYFQTAKDRGLPACLITDAGHTEIPAGTKTAVGIGPALEADIDKVTGGLKLLG
ncbi:MAG: peptidyl-tRNA hydrolase Pth2 [Candidatus Undinarchaeales archaeon]|jgi:PTH2 family peptidyl-tRNA hydrolase|nr:peptidyl-tRNA hydrolase Pth2 [Candidatus Undinarchaeales archaeon]